MRNIRNYALVVCMLLCVSVMSGCLFGGKKAFSCDKVWEAFAEYDAEEYHSLDDMKKDVENGRALLAGMYIRLEGDSIKKGLTADKIGDVFGSDQSDLIKNTYSKMITEAVMLIQSEETSGGGELKMAVVGMDFDDSNDAERYYNAYVKHLKKAFDDTDSDMMSGIEFCTASSCLGNKASCQRVYRYRDSVLVVAGYERMDNGITAKLQSICGIIGVEAPDISDYDCVSKAGTGGRLDALINEYSLTEIPAKDFPDKCDNMAAGNYYAHTDNAGDVQELIDDSPFESYMIISFRGVLIRPKATSGSAVYEFKVRSAEEAEDMYQKICKEMKDGNSKELTNLSEGEQNGVEYCSFDVSMYISQMVYAAYRDGDTIYMIVSSGSKQTEARKDFSGITGLMGLPG